MRMFLSLCLVLLFCTNGLAQEVQATDETIPFLYESRADVKTPDHELASMMSSDYRQARDEFTKHDLFQKIKPVLEKRLKEAGQTQKIFLHVGGSLGDYDFNKKAFPTGVSEGTFVPFRNGYAVSFTNANNVSFLPLAQEKARTLSGALRKGRGTTMTFYCTVLDAKEQDLNYLTKKNLRVKIDRFDIKLRSGETIGSLITAKK